MLNELHSKSFVSNFWGAVHPGREGFFYSWSGKKAAQPHCL